MRESKWATRTVLGIVAATFFSDVGHEMVTAVLPLYLGTIGLGAAALGVMEGLADLAYSASKLAGGVLGQRVQRKRLWVAGGYFVTLLGTAAIALVQSVASVISLRTVAWIGRGIRSPMRDFMLADEVGPTHFGRAYGLERSADMLGAVVGPLVAAAMVWAAAGVQSVILWSVVPSMLAVGAIVLLTRDRAASEPAAAQAPAPEASSGEPRRGQAPFPREYWLFVVGVLLFGLGDFSRTFLILLAARALGETQAVGLLSMAVLLYAGHNFISGLAAYPAGKLGDRVGKSRVLIAGYALGVVTNVVFAFSAGSLPLLLVAIAASGIYIAIEETLEKAVVAQVLPREQRSLGLGVLASVNALGDFASSLMVGLLIASGHVRLAFLILAAFSALGVLWMGVVVIRRRGYA